MLTAAVLTCSLGSELKACSRKPGMPSLLELLGGYALHQACLGATSSLTFQDRR